MLNKLKLNNLIITNKKKIQQGRIQVINKQVHKIRKLKNLLEKRQVNFNIKAKLLKSTDILTKIKEFKCADIVKRILSLDHTPEVIISRADSLSEDIAISLFATNKIIKSLVIDFKKILNLNDANSISWKNEILYTSKRQAKIQRTEKKRQQRKEFKENRAQSKKRLEWLQENNPTTTCNKSFMDCMTISTPEHLSTENNVQNVGSTNSTLIEKNKKYNLNKHSESKQKQCDTLHNNKNSLLEKSDQINGMNITHVMDSFFITETGENYHSSVVTAPNNARNFDTSNCILLKKNDKESKNNRIPINIHNLKAKNDKAFHSSCLAKKNASIHSFQSKKSFVTEDEKISNENFGLKNKCNAYPIKSNNLHPVGLSKQKPLIAKFEGKKIVFNFNDE